MGRHLVSRGPHFLWPESQVVLQPLLGLFGRVCRRTIHVRIVGLDPC
uniref:Uncharacterized protein n=1 Tax=Lepeophtheirus salmonis TaxID=72036 RepID=A0A0K2VD98_LEPSM